MLNAKALKNLDKDDLLGLLGLETKRTTADWLVPTVTAFTLGVAVGVGVGLLLAPRAAAMLGEDAHSRTPIGGSNTSSAHPRDMERSTGTR